MALGLNPTYLITKKVNEWGCNIITISNQKIYFLIEVIMQKLTQCNRCRLVDEAKMLTAANLVEVLVSEAIVHRIIF